MHGLGNDFVILDTRDQDITLNESAVRRLSDRRFGVGCDQFITLNKPSSPQASVKMRIFNADGGEVEACGNASRCVSWLLSREGIQEPVLETIPGVLPTKVIDGTQVQVDMGPASFEWQKIPLSSPLDEASLNVAFDTLVDPVAVNVGNPHIIFFVKDLESVDINRLGASLSKHPLFPEGTNVEIASPLDFKTLKVKVWERGVGVTPACGSGACAAGAAAFKHGLVDREVQVQLEGGNLTIETLPNEHVLMTGPVELTFEGTFDKSLIA